MAMSDTILVERRGPVATITLNRPEVLNAFDAATIAGLRDALTALAGDAAVRVAVLAGAGSAFCAGGDMRWMRKSLDWSAEENLADATALADMFDAAWGFPKPLIARVNGAAIGGGAGLVACCDLAIAGDNTRFGFGEVKIGLIPAVIAQYVVPKIGFGHARALFVSGERFTAERAFEIGLVHAVAAEDDLDATVAAVVARVLTSGPEAVAETKRALDAVWWLEREAARRYVVEAIAGIRTRPEAQEGLRAFLEKRRPAWLE
jgi:methylglutaconyl-CoA hydratase